MDNIYLELELFLDPPITDAAAMKEYLEKDTKWGIPFWDNNTNASPKYGVMAAAARESIAEGLTKLAAQAKEAVSKKYVELESEAETINKIGVTERHTKKLVNKFKKFFKEKTITGLLSDGETVPFVIPAKPEVQTSLNTIPSYSDMKNIADDLKLVGKKDLYDLLGVNTFDKTADIHTKAKNENDRIHKLPVNITKDALNRLATKFMFFFANDNNRKSYDIALKTFPFWQFADKILSIYADKFLEDKATDGKLYADAIRNALSFVSNEDEAEWLVYEYFCCIKKCPKPDALPKPSGTLKPLPAGTPASASATSDWQTEKKKILTALRLLCTDTAGYHNGVPDIKTALEICMKEIFTAEKNKADSPNDNLNSVLASLQKLKSVWETYRNDNGIGTPFWRPDSWTRFDDKFPSHTITKFIQEIK
jgi:hypothetical protein